MKNITETNIERAFDLLTCLNGRSLETMMAQEGCSSPDETEEVIESRFQSLAFNCGVSADELFAAAEAYSNR